MTPPTSGSHALGPAHQRKPLLHPNSYQLSFPAILPETVEDISSSQVRSFFSSFKPNFQGFPITFCILHPGKVGYRALWPIVKADLVLKSFQEICSKSPSFCTFLGFYISLQLFHCFLLFILFILLLFMYLFTLCIYLFIGLGPHQRCSEITSRCVLKNHSWWCSGNI